VHRTTGRLFGGGARAGAVHPFDLAQVILGALLFIASFLPFYTYSVGGFGGSVSAWNGFFAWFGVLLGLAAAVALAAAMFAHVAVPFLRRVVLGLFAASAACVLLALFVLPFSGYDNGGLSSGHSVGYWLALICSLAGSALAFLRRDETDIGA
jgi:hypothetical protein